MSKYFVIVVFLLFAFASDALYSQQLVYEGKKELDYYFDKSDSHNDAVFTLLGDNLSSASYFKYQLRVEVEVYKQQNRYPIKIKIVRDNVECRYRYRGFQLSDFIVADKINLQGNLTSGQISLVNFEVTEKEIPSSDIILDTVLISDVELNYFYFSISEIKLFITEKGITTLQKGLKAIDDFFRYDSLYADWNLKMDEMNLSNVDRIPVFQFQLEELEQEIFQYDKNEYEVLLSRSGKDNQEYLHKRSVLLSRIAEQKLAVSKKMAAMDVLMYEEGKHFEKENDIEKAIFYYNRALDYNPSHCEALEKLSDLYLQNNLHQQNLDLFAGLKVRGEDIVCESTLTSTVCDSMCMKANSLISKKNYYDAIKFLDTLELLFYQMPDTSYMQIYYSLKKQVQEGIYDSYFEVIGSSIKNGKLELGKEYIYGVTDIMQKDGNNPEENQKYKQMMERFLARHSENTRSQLRRRNYANIISTNDGMLVFLDSIHYSYNKEIFKDSYTTSHTAIYLEKKKYSEMQAEDYYKAYAEYITAIHGQENLLLTENNGNFEMNYTKSRYDNIARYISQWNQSNADFAVLDSLSVFFQMEEDDYDMLVLPQTIRIISETVSKINQLTWSNELLQASELMGKVDNILPSFDLQQTDSSLFQKYKQTKDLFHDHFSKRAEQEYYDLVAKAEKLFVEKDYIQAHNLLRIDNPFLQQSMYQAQLSRMIEKVRIPAEFQTKMFTAQQDLALGDFIEGFIFYEDAYQYFMENNVAQYDLACDSLLVFVKKRRQNNFLQSAIVYFMNNNNYANALDVMMYASGLGYANEDLQIQLGEKMKSVSYNLDSLKGRYSFSKVHKPFLKSFLGGFNAFWYTMKGGFAKKKN